MKSKKISKAFTFLNTIIFLFIIVSIFSSFIPYFKIDLQISEKIQSISSSLVAFILEFVSHMGNYPIMLYLVAVTCLVMFLWGFKSEAVIGSLSLAGGALSGSLVKILTSRPRPDSDLISVRVWLTDNSYPSNHVLVFTVFFGFLIYLVLIKIKHRILGLAISLFLLLLIFSVGISRIYLGAHWASDVLGGYLLGIFWLILSIKLYNSHNGKR